MYSAGKKPSMVPPGHLHQPPPPPPIHHYSQQGTSDASYEISPLPLAKSLKVPQQAAAQNVSRFASHHAGRNVQFETDADYESIDVIRRKDAVSIEMGNVHERHSEDEDSSDDEANDRIGSLAALSQRSDISSAPSVEHFNISFEFKKTFREHKGARTMKAYHKILKLVYNRTLTWSYNILLFVLGIVITILWALINAAVAFLQTWFISPVMRVSLVIIRGLLPIILEPLGLIIKTFGTACGCGAGCLDNLGGLQSQFKFRPPAKSFLA